MARPNARTFLGLAVLVAGFAACGDSPPPDTSNDAKDSTTSTTTGTTADTSTPPPTATATTPPPPKTKGPGKVGAFVEGNKKAAKPGVKLAAALKAEEEGALHAKLDAAVEKEGENMQFSGSPAAAKFKQGEVLEITVTVEPNKCYTVVAVSDAGITELDTNIVVTAPVPVPVAVPPLATDSTTGADSTLGGGGNCIKSPLPTPSPATVQVKATKGAGVAAVQVLVK